MKYDLARLTIKSGDVLAWTHKKWNSLYDLQVQAVRLFTQSEYCHVGVAWVVSGRVFVIEAVTPKVRIYPLSKLLPFYLIRTKPYWNDIVEERALSRVGDSYSKKQAILAFLNKIKNSEDSLWECAEQTIDILSAGMILPLQTQATPSNVVQKLLELDYRLEWIE